MNQTTVFLDIETDRLDPKTANPIQIAMVAVNRATLEEIDSFESKIKFDATQADPDALERNCYDVDIWEREAIEPFRAMENIRAFLLRHGDWSRVSRRGNNYYTAEIAGHNAANYDAVVLASFFKRHEAYLPAATWVTGPVDTMHMARCIEWLKNERWESGFSLGALCQRFDISLENEHDAMADVRATVELAGVLRGIFGESDE